MRKLFYAAAIAAGALILAAPAASAHVTASQSTAPADGFATIDFQVPHGCDGQATRVVSVQLRDDIASVKAEAVPGWTVAYERKPLDEPIELHGEPVTEYVSVVSWTAAAAPLPDDQFLRFGISMKMPNLEGERILFPTVQDCVDGSESAWIDEDPEAERPAPAVELVAGDEPTEASGESEEAAAEVTDADTASSSSDDADPIARGLSGAALAVAVVGAGVALRRRSS